MNNNWYAKIEEREFHGKPQGKWIVSGWYQDEKKAFKTAKAIWEEKQQLEYAEYRNNKTLAELAAGDANLNMIDDYFHWNVITPHWYLHKNGTWNKLICAHHGEVSFGGPGLMSGEYGSYELVAENLKKWLPPDRFENYQEHLQTAREPISRDDWERIDRN